MKSKALSILKMVLIWLTVTVVCYKCGTGCKEVNYKVSGTVVSHAVTADRSGYRTFSTIIRLDNGSIVEKTDLSFYAVKEGERVSYNVHDIKFEW
jgi:formylmethanofuran dehydrogenase subunit B